MTKLQLGLLASSFFLLFSLYFGCETTPLDIRALEKSRALEIEAANPEVLIQEAKATLGPQALNEVMVLEEELSRAPNDSARVGILQELSGAWYRLENPAIAGDYAQQVAELLGDAESWSIAATTYTICVQRTEAGRLREFCTDRAVQAYESAISLDPADISHKVNLALLYTENPPAENPMRGISMLLDLNSQEPENVLILNSLGRLAIRTGQYDRALERLQKALRLDPDNATTPCLLAQVYDGLGDAAQAETFNDRCRQLARADSSN